MKEFGHWLLEQRNDEEVNIEEFLDDSEVYPDLYEYILEDDNYVDIEDNNGNIDDDYDYFD